jgi:hypothetical protein
MPARRTQASRGRPAPPRRQAAPRRAAARRVYTVARWGAVAAAVVWGVVARRRLFGDCIHDDAFISFRYARHLVRGDGLVMNPGERVEGFTNFLWTVLAAPVIALGGDPVWWSQLAGAALAVGLVAALFVFGEKRLGGGWYALVAPAVLTFSPAYVMESLSGLETLFFTALVFAAYVTFLEERRHGGRAPGAWAAWCGLATLTRPEGGLVFAVLAAHAGLGVRRGEPPGRLVRALAVYALLVAPLVVWRLAYYGSPLPNTFYAKVGYTTAQLLRGWRFMSRSVGWSLTPALLLVAAGFGVLALLRRQRVPGVPAPVATWTRWFAGRPRDEAIAVGLGLWIAYFAYILLVGGDYEPTGRFYMPVLPILALLYQEGLRSFVLLCATTGRVAHAVAAVAALAVGTGILADSHRRIEAVLRARRWPQGRASHHEQLRAVGTWLGTQTPPGTLVAVSSIGALAYYADRPIVDMMGLTDRRIGRTRMALMGRGPAGHEKGDGAYVLGRRPHLILLDKGHFFSAPVEPQRVFDGARGISELELLELAEFERDYVLRSAELPGGVLYYFERRDDPVTPARAPAAPSP